MQLALFSRTGLSSCTCEPSGTYSSQRDGRELFCVSWRRRALRRIAERLLKLYEVDRTTANERQSVLLDELPVEPSLLRTCMIHAGSRRSLAFAVAFIVPVSLRGQTPTSCAGAMRSLARQRKSARDSACARLQGAALARLRFWAVEE